MTFNKGSAKALFRVFVVEAGVCLANIFTYDREAVETRGYMGTRGSRLFFQHGISTSII